ncbi:thioesterase domain-containing protein, partial [Bradyrhizobium sp.]|uniref:thioesterase domain-containing protein n=1 Tax=Bradyrhizobium sp. TaxID=376 RepID=UPI003C35720B
MKTRQTGRRPATALLAAAILLCAGAELARAGDVAALGQPTSQSPAHRLPQTKDAPGPAVVSAPPQAEAPPIVPRGRVYLFRGAMGLIFSRGMDRLTEKLERAGITANVYEFTLCSLITGPAIDEYRRDPEPIILIGHSMGGRCALQFAEKLQDEGIPVSLVVTIDPAHLSPDVPLNVERFINIFLSKDVLGGGDIKPAPGFQGDYA